MPLAGHDASSLCQGVPVLIISTPMPLAGHDQIYTDNFGVELISTPMPLAGHDSGLHQP